MMTRCKAGPGGLTLFLIEQLRKPIHRVERTPRDRRHGGLINLWARLILAIILLLFGQFNASGAWTYNAGINPQWESDRPLAYLIYCTGECGAPLLPDTWNFISTDTNPEYLTGDAAIAAAYAWDPSTPPGFTGEWPGAGSTTLPPYATPAYQAFTDSITYSLAVIVFLGVLTIVLKVGVRIRRSLKGKGVN